MGQPGDVVIRTKPRVGPALVGVLVLAAAAGSFLSSMPWLRAYNVTDAPLLFALAAAAPALISAAVTRSLRFTPLVSYGVSATGLVLLLAGSNRFDLSEVGYGLVHVPAHLLTETLPLTGDSYLLAGPIVLTWLCAAWSAEALLRPSRPAATALAVPVCYFVLAYAATTSAPAGPTAYEGAAVLATVVITALARHGLIARQVNQAQVTSASPSNFPSSGPNYGPNYGPNAAPGSGPASRARHFRGVRRPLVAGAMAALLSAALALVVPSLPGFASEPAALTRSTQLLTGTVVDPLDALASMRDSSPSAPPVTLMSVKVDQAWAGYVTLAILDDYDGDSWTFSDTFRPTGGRVPGAASADFRATREVTAEYTLERSIGMPFLPAIGRPVQVTGLGVDANAATGMLAATVTGPVSYKVVSRMPLRTGASLEPSSALAEGKDVPGGDNPAYTALPPGSTSDVAAAVRFAIQVTREPASSSLPFLEDVAGSLRHSERRVVARPSHNPHSVPAAFAGTSLAQVMNAVTVDRAATPEQFATFFAVVARYLGVPVRVVTGFRVPAAATSKRLLAPGTYKLTNRDAWTWDEVPVRGYGWVVVDPTPVVDTFDASAPPEQVKPGPPTKPRQATALPGNAAAHAIAKGVKVNVSVPLHVDWLLALGAGLPGAIILAFIAGGLGVPALRRRLRRLARHQQGDPALLAAGAWLELLDGLSRLGLDIDASATSTEVLAQLATRFGEDFLPPAKVVGSIADQALYSTEWPVQDAQARLAWASQRQLRHRLRRCVGRRQRARALLYVGHAPARPAAPGYDCDRPRPGDEGRAMRAGR